MKAILLAGGHATRLWPVTRHRPKPLLPMGDRTILDRLLDQLEPIASDILVSTNARFEDAFTQAIRDRAGARLVVEEQASEAEKPGALGALIQLLEDVDPGEPLLVAGGDNHYGFDMAEFVEAAGTNDGPTVAVKALADREQAKSFGVVELDEGTRIQAFHEKPEDPPSKLAATALYYYPEGWRTLFDTFEKVAQASEDTRAMLDAPGRILEWAVQDGRPVHAWAFEAPWYDIGTAEGYLDALGQVVGPRYVEGELEDCREGPGVYVFGDARAHGSRLERTVLFPGAVVEGSELSGCLVDSHAEVHHAQLVDSRLGPYDVVAGERGR